jgi:hypothetical protein
LTADDDDDDETETETETVLQQVVAAAEPL